MSALSAPTLIRQIEPLIRLFLSDGSERSDYLPQARALALLGVGAAPRLAATLAARPARIRLGDTVTFSVTLASASPRAQSLAVDYVVHYVRPSGRASAKVFKWTTLDLAPGETATLTKRQTVRDFSTRKHHPGVHRVELQVNGRRLAETAFTLRA